MFVTINSTVRSNLNLFTETTDTDDTFFWFGSLSKSKPEMDVQLGKNNNFFGHFSKMFIRLHQ